MRYFTLYFQCRWSNILFSWKNIKHENVEDFSFQESGIINLCTTRIWERRNVAGRHIWEILKANWIWRAKDYYKMKHSRMEKKRHVIIARSLSLKNRKMFLQDITEDLKNSWEKKVIQKGRRHHSALVPIYAFEPKRYEFLSTTEHDWWGINSCFYLAWLCHVKEAQLIEENIGMWYWGCLS